MPPKVNQMMKRHRPRPSEKKPQREWVWTDRQRVKAKKVCEVVLHLKEYCPLTLRQIFYQLVAQNYKNTRSQYNMLSALVKQMRLEGWLPWTIIEDRTRRITDKRGFNDPDEFIQQELKRFLSGYGRCLTQDQENYVELWIEKDALSRIFEDIAWKYCIRCVTCKGFSSVTFIHDFAERAKRAQAQGQTPVLLYFGDLDPSGVKMFEVIQNSLRNEHKVYGIDYRRIALNQDQVEEYDLPTSVDAIKEKDTRTPAYVKKYGDIAVELDALHPKLLKELTENALTEVLDIDLMLDHQELEEHDLVKIDQLKGKVKTLFEQEGYSVDKSKKS